MDGFALLESRMKAFMILDTVTVPDGFGGYNEALTDGAPFDGAAVIKDNTEALIAYQNGAKKIYHVVTRQTVRLKRNMKIRRIEDGLTLRVTSDATDFKTPDISDLKLYQVSAEAIDV